MLARSGRAFRVVTGRFLGSRWALLAAVLYMLMPYHLTVNWDMRLAIGEFAAYAFAPFIGHSIWALFEGKSGSPGLALSAAGLALSHLPSLVICALTCCRRRRSGDARAETSKPTMSAQVVAPAFHCRSKCFEGLQAQDRAGLIALTRATIRFRNGGLYRKLIRNYSAGPGRHYWGTTRCLRAE